MFKIVFWNVGIHVAELEGTEASGNGIQKVSRVAKEGCS